MGHEAAKGSALRFVPDFTEGWVGVARVRKPVRRYIFPVTNLDVPVGWRVGRARFRPRSWLGRQVDQPQAFVGAPDLWAARVRADVDAVQSATVEVLSADAERARSRAADAVAVLRLYQRARYPRLPLDRQTFGLAADVVSGHEDHWTISPSGSVGGGSQRHGVLAPWTFSADDVHAFEGTPPFAFLDQALRSRRPSEMQRRAVAAVQARDLARISVPPALRIIGLAVAIETILGDERSRDRAHRIARRIAFLDCGQPDRRCGRDRLACFYLEAKTTSEVTKGVTAWQQAGYPGLCSLYWKVRRVFDNRNAAVHRGTRFPEKKASDHAYAVDDWLLAALDWASIQDPRAPVDVPAAIDKEITAAVAAGVLETPLAASDEPSVSVASAAADRAAPSRLDVSRHRRTPLATLARVRPRRPTRPP